MDKSKSAEVSELLKRLQQGESVVCLDCGQGEYKTSAKDLSDACDFVCDKCGSVLRFSKNITVEQYPINLIPQNKKKTIKKVVSKMPNKMYKRYYKENPDDLIWWLDTFDRDGVIVFSFDKKTDFNLFRDYPYKLTPEQKEIFDRENPFWKDFFSSRS